MLHNSRVLANNLNEKLEILGSDIDTIMCCLAQNVNNGIGMFNPQKMDAEPLCSIKPLNNSSVIEHVKKFIKNKGKITEDNQRYFRKYLSELRGRKKKYNRSKSAKNCLGFIDYIFTVN